MTYTNNPERDEKAYQDALEAHMALFPTCEICGMSLMNEDPVIYMKNRWYCSDCAEVMTNDEMREACNLD